MNGGTVMEAEKAACVFVCNSGLFVFLQKPLLADEHRVDYVQVDEKKTQALQSTKLEWKDVRQSKS